MRATLEGRAQQAAMLFVSLMCAGLAVVTSIATASADERGGVVINAPALTSSVESPGARAPSDAYGSGVIRRGSERSRTAGASESSAGGASSLASQLRLWIPLGFVLLIIAAVAWVARRVFPRVGRTGSDGAISVLSRHAISPRQSLCLVRLGRRVVLLGVTPDNINTLVEISDADEASHLTAAAASRRPDSFSAALAGMMRAYRPQTADATADEMLEPPAIGSKQSPRQSGGMAALVDRVRGMAQHGAPGGAAAHR